MKKIILLPIIYLIALSSSYSQSYFRPGFIQINEFDTIFGLICYQNDILSTRTCYFKKDQNDEAKEYTSKEIFGYRINDGKYYVSKKIASEALDTNKNSGDIKDSISLFIEFLVKGKVNLYYYRDIVFGEHYLVDKPGAPLKEISFHDEILYKDGKAFKRKSMINKPLLRMYLNDCPEILNDVSEVKTRDHVLLINLFEKYHKECCPDETCLLYEKKVPKFEVDIQLVAGILKFNLGDELTSFNSNYCAMYGFLTYVWLPVSNEKLFFKTGLIYSNVTGINTSIVTKKDTSYNFTKIPVQFHYNNLKKKICPTFSAGVSFYMLNRKMSYLFSVDIGVNLQISSRLSFSAVSDLDYLRSASHSFFAGVKYKL